MPGYLLKYPEAVSVFLTWLLFHLFFFGSTDLP